MLETLVVAPAAGKDVPVLKALLKVAALVKIGKSAAAANKKNFFILNSFLVEPISKFHFGINRVILASCP